MSVCETENDVKDRLLEQYGRRDPIALYQYDGHDGVVSGSIGDGQPDFPGHPTYDTKVTAELMSGVAVRVLINPKTKREVVLELLRMLTKAIEGDSRVGSGEPVSVRNWPAVSSIQTPMTGDHSDS